MSEALKPMTSEERLDISKQPPETCPLIDAVIATIKDANRSLKGYEKMDEEELKKAMWDVETDLDRCRPKGFKGAPPKWESPDGVLEAIRTQCQDIRAWGQEWKDLALHHETERDNALAEVEALTAERDRLREERDSAITMNKEIVHLCDTRGERLATLREEVEAKNVTIDTLSKRVNSLRQCARDHEMNFRQGNVTIATLRGLLERAKDMLGKYQSRYHGASHAQKHWEIGAQVVAEIESALEGKSNG